MKIVRKYEKASGQRIKNFSLLFCKRVLGNVRQTIQDTLKIQNEGGMGSYLGVPEYITGSKCKLFAYLKDILRNKVNGRIGRWLSRRKKVLITSILLVFPTYVMYSFLVPLEICESLASAIL